MQDGRGRRENGNRRVLTTASGLQKRGVNVEQVLLTGGIHLLVSGSNFNTCKVTGSITVPNRQCILDK